MKKLIRVIEYENGFIRPIKVDESEVGAYLKSDLKHLISPEFHDDLEIVVYKMDREVNLEDFLNEFNKEKV